MPNRVYIKNNIARKKKNDAAAEKLDQEAKKRMLWGFQKDRSSKKEQDSTDDGEK